MDEQAIGYVILGLILAAGIAYFRYLVRERPEDRFEIEDFARSHALQIISVKRSSGLTSWFRGSLGSNTRIYEVVVEDSQGDRADVQVAFECWVFNFLVSDSWFESGPLKVLRPYGLTLVPRSQGVNLKQLASVVPPSWRWHERLTIFVLGACIGGFAFCAGMRDLASPQRPKVPDITLGYAHLLESARYGPVYVTHFEHWAGTYGSKLSLGCFMIVGLFATYALKIERKGRGFGLQILLAIVISYALYDVFWRAFDKG